MPRKTVLRAERGGQQRRAGRPPPTGRRSEPVDAERRPLAFRRGPPGDVADADGEGGAGEAEKEAAARRLRESVGGGTSRHGPATTSRSTANTARPPNRSAACPSVAGRAIRGAPGVAIRRPVALPVRSSVSRKRGANAPTSPQAAKQTAKEVVASASCRFVALPPAASRPARSLTPGSSASSPAYYRAWLRRHGAPARANAGGDRAAARRRASSPAASAPATGSGGWRDCGTPPAA